MTITQEPVNRIITVSKLVDMLKEYPPDTLVFVKNEKGEYSTAIKLDLDDDGDLEVTSS